MFNPQITNTIASDASPMRDEYYLPEHRPLVVFNSQNVDLINPHALPSMRDEDYLPEHRPLVVFRSQTINPPSATCPQSLHNATWADFLRFTLCLPLRVPRSVLRHISRCYTLCRPPLFCLLVNLVCDIYAILKCAYVFDERRHAVAVLVRVASMRFCLRSHDFVALLCKTMLKLSCLPLSILQNLSRSCTSLCLPLTRLSSSGLSKLRFHIGRKPPILKSRALNPCVLLSPRPLSMPTPPSVSRIGGGCSRLAWATIQPYATSKPGTLGEQSSLHYVAHVDKLDLKGYPSDRFLHADIPLPVATQLLPITVACSFAKIHGVDAGSRCTVAQLRSCVQQHKCLDCPSYITIFSVEDGSIKKNARRTKMYREKKTRLASATLDDSESKLPEFPPPPCSIELEHTIIKDVCKRMDPANFEEIGCAVCGELRPRNKTSRLRNVKNLLNILEAPGVTCIE